MGVTYTQWATGLPRDSFSEIASSEKVILFLKSTASV